jgi:proteasome accessory factor A
MLRHFTTSAILQLMEDEALGDVPQLRDPVRDLWHNVATRNPDQWRVELEDGSTVSPIEIQRYYLGKIETIAEDAWEKRALRTLEEVLDALENRRSKEAARRVEWLDRYLAIQEAAEETEGPDVEMMACKQYSEIGAERSLFYKRQRAGLVERITDDDAIKRAITEPPVDTRAKLRREICDTFNIEMIDWSVLVVNDGTRRRIELLDPYATKMEATYATAG